MKLRDQVTGMLDQDGFLFLTNHVLKIVERNRNTMMLLRLDILSGGAAEDGTTGRGLNVVADVIVKTFRGSDVKARVGDTRFVVLALDAAPESQGLLEGRLQSAFAVYNKKAEGDARLEVAISATVFEGGARVTAQSLLAD